MIRVEVANKSPRSSEFEKEEVCTVPKLVNEGRPESAESRLAEAE
jgi:hypothetical protein